MTHYQNTFSFHYDGWRKSRMDGLLKYIDSSFFKDKLLLELGCGFGDLGNMFYDLGCKVTCTDARKNHLDEVNKKYPQLVTKLLDCDSEKTSPIFFPE